MSTAEVEVVHDEGQPVVRKRAQPGPAQERLDGEAAALAHARHPGVVRLLDAVSGPDGSVVTTRWAGSHTLATLAPPSPEQAAGLVAALATVVADIHDGGVVHGRITADHVVVGAGGRPLLCGFGEATVPGSVRRRAPSDDVADLGSVLHQLVAGEVEAEPIPEHRRWTLRRQHWTGYQRRVLMTLADQALHDDPDRRPTARAFAAAVLEAVPSARLPEAGPTDPPVDATAMPSGPGSLVVRAGPGYIDDPPTAAPPASAADAGANQSAGPSSAPSTMDVLVGRASGAKATARHGPRHRRRRSPLARAVVAGALLLALLVVGLHRSSGGGRPDEVAVPASSRTDPTPPGADVPSADPPPAGGSSPRTSAGPAPGSTPAPGAPSTVVTVRPPSVPPSGPQASCPAATAPVADVDGDGCPEPVRLDGGVVVVGATRLGVGRPGDLVEVGDWDCDGEVSVAVARPRSGEVFAFDGWARPGAPVEVAATTVVERLTAVEVVDGGDACDDLVVIDEVGGRHPVDLDGGR